MASLCHLASKFSSLVFVDDNVISQCHRLDTPVTVLITIKCLFSRLLLIISQYTRGYEHCRAFWENCIHGNKVELQIAASVECISGNAARNIGDSVFPKYKMCIRRMDWEDR